MAALADSELTWEWKKYEVDVFWSGIWDKWMVVVSKVGVAMKGHSQIKVAEALYRTSLNLLRPP